MGYDPIFSDRNVSSSRSDTTNFGIKTVLDESGLLTSPRTHASVITPLVEIQKHINEDPCVVGLIYNRAREVGLAKCYTRTMHFVITQMLDDSSFSGTLQQLSACSVQEILIPSTCVESSFLTTLRVWFHDVEFVAVARKLFSDSDGLCYLSPESSVYIDAKDKYLCLASLAAVLRYLTELHKIRFIPGTLRVEYHRREKYMELSRSTMQALQLLPQRRTNIAETSTSNRSVGPRSKQNFSQSNELAVDPDEICLADAIDHTRTQMGRRFLYASIVQPIVDIRTLELRTGAVQYLMHTQAVRNEVVSILNNVQDLDRLVAFFTLQPTNTDRKYTSQRLGRTNAIRKSMMLVERVSKVLLSAVDANELLSNIRQACDSTHLREFSQKLDDFFEPTLSETDNVFSEEGSGTFRCAQNYFCLRENLNPELDDARREFSVVMTRMLEECSRLQEKYSIPSLRVAHAQNDGFHWSLEVLDAARVPDHVFLRQHRRKKRISCTTREMMSHNLYSDNLTRKIVNAADLIAEDISKEIRANSSILFKVIDALSLLDFLCSLAQAAVGWGTLVCRPQFEKQELRIRKGKSPTMVSHIGAMNRREVQYNDVNLSLADKSFSLICGANMSGKTCYLQQAGQLCVLACIGSMLPAEEAVIPNSDRICSRMGCDDSIENDASTFAQEMIEIAHILQCSTQSSLVLIDEVGRSTNHHDGGAIAFAIASYLAEQRVLSLMTTHYTELVSLANLYYQVQVQHFVVHATPNGLRFTHVLVDGSCPKSHYGLDLAATLGFPEEVLTEARTLLTQKEERDLRGEQASSNIPQSCDSMKGRPETVQREVLQEIHGVLNGNHESSIIFDALRSIRAKYF